MNTYEFGKALSELNFNFYSGVPCSYLKDLINYSINECDYVMAANEGDAVAICAGAAVGGKKSVFLCQNSGLTNAISPLTSLSYTFQIPVLGFVSLRGEVGIPDEPQHELMGQVTTELLDTMKIKWEYLSLNYHEAIKQVQLANQHIENNQSFFFVVRKDTFDKVALREQKVDRSDEILSKTILGHKLNQYIPTRTEALQIIQQEAIENSILVATTGFTGRELYAIDDLDNQFYMVGSMGCASSFSLGLALARPDQRVICIDGDGALMMRMGSLTTNAYYGPSNLLHILLDNHAHESTGRQFTVASVVDFAQVAHHSGYRYTTYIEQEQQLRDELTRWFNQGQLSFYYIQTKLGVPDQLGRPKTKPYEVKERLMRRLGTITT
ncbi:phosphonopyruvate decarboxylase [Paenibacillus endoradicis]|uniref:phosphonopyruvate decarboxylase n=1 Tax=Paenibacillus endoradicis TaxID=2972487 RepID=UPI0021591F49|nr:phosphonopyruvate decarboxylase [Paenibacillus endoradicis]MCR8660539.1 phosphonopyruvate decarboxylase [Paenibacillus endoradicis]